MRHTNVLLRHPINIKEKLREKQEQDHELQSIKDEIQALQQMLSMPGWKYFVRACKEEELDILRGLELVENPTKQATLTGSLLATKSHQTWAEDRVQSLLPYLADPKQT